MLQFKIEKDNNTAKYITTLRKYDQSLSIGEIKSRIENGAYVIKHDLYSWDICDDMNNVDRNQLFRKLINDLTNIGASLLIYDEDNEITLQQLDNLLNTYYQIEHEVEEDIDNEVEGYW